MPRQMNGGYLNLLFREFPRYLVRVVTFLRHAENASHDFGGFLVNDIIQPLLVP